MVYTSENILIKYYRALIDAVKYSKYFLNKAKLITDIGIYPFPFN